MAQFNFITRNNNKLSILSLEINEIFSTISFELNDDNTISIINDQGEIICTEYINTLINELCTFINNIQTQNDADFIIQNRVLMCINQSVFTILNTQLIFQYDLDEYCNPILDILYKLKNWLTSLMI